VSFNAVFRDGCLNRRLFESARETGETSEAWLEEYNEERPHGSPGGLTPSKFFEQMGRAKERKLPDGQARSITTTVGTGAGLATK
jgi:putative transposase